MYLAKKKLKTFHRISALWFFHWRKVKLLFPILPLKQSHNRSIIKILQICTKNTIESRVREWVSRKELFSWTMAVHCGQWFLLSTKIPWVLWYLDLFVDYMVPLTTQIFKGDAEKLASVWLKRQTLGHWLE